MNIGSAPIGSTILDSKISGLTCRIGKRRCTFSLQFTENKKQRKVVIGHYPNISVEEARVLAAGLLSSKDKNTARTSDKTLQDCYDLWLATKSRKLKLTTIRQYKCCWNYLKPLHHFKVSDISYHNLQAVHDQVGGVMANRVIIFASVLLHLASKMNWTTVRDVAGLVDRNRERRRTRKLNDIELHKMGVTIKKWLKDCNQYKAQFANLLKLYLFTGARRNEIYNLTREMIDFHSGVIRLPDSKTGAKDIPISRQTMDVLNSMRLPPSGRIFKFVNLDRLWAKFKDEATLGDLKIHDLRRTFASIGLSEGVGLDQIGQVLGHKSATTTRSYAYLTNDASKRCAEVAGNKINSLLEGSL